MPTIMPFGLSPLGLAVPPVFGPRALPPVIAAEKIDLKTRDVASLLVSENVVDAQVVLAMSVLRGSGAAVDLTGQRFRDVGKLTDNAKTLLDTEARTAVAALLLRGDITIDSITIEIDSAATWAELTLNYINQRAVGLRTRQHVQRVEASTR